MTDVLKGLPGHFEVAPGVTSEEIDLDLVDKIIERVGREESTVIPMLQAIQREFRYLPRRALEYVCENTDITPSRIVGVTTPTRTDSSPSSEWRVSAAAPSPPLCRLTC